MRVCVHMRVRTVLFSAGLLFSSDKMTLELFLPEDICFQWVCQVQHLILSHRHEGLKSTGVSIGNWIISCFKAVVND